MARRDRARDRRRGRRERRLGAGAARASAAGYSDESVRLAARGLGEGALLGPLGRDDDGRASRRGDARDAADEIDGGGRSALEVRAREGRRRADRMAQQRGRRRVRPRRGAARADADVRAGIQRRRRAHQGRGLRESSAAEPGAAEPCAAPRRGRSRASAGGRDPYRAAESARRLRRGRASDGSAHPGARWRRLGRCAPLSIRPRGRARAVRGCARDARARRPRRSPRR